MSSAALAGVAVVLVIAIALLLARPTKVHTANPAPASAQPRPSALGSVGCSAAGCHGGPLDGPAGRSSSAATLWFARDPHARAFDALTSELGRSIACQMGIIATRDKRCLACHTNPATVLNATGAVDTSVPALAIRREGVGCESCHGSADRWIVPHTTWFSTPEQRPGAYTGHGMTWLNDLSVRARVCAGCHVGAPEDTTNRVPQRDVTHEMIAAGHPRLAFEFASYSRALPQHWTEIDRTRRAPADRGPEHFAREWLVGQVVCGEALLRLIATDAEEKGPEFARYDCYGCHHKLVPGDQPVRVGRLGRPEIDRWYLSHPLLQLAAEGQGLEPVAKMCAANWRNRADVRSSARTAADALAKWSAGAKTDAELDARAEAAFRALRRGGVPRDLNWNDAAQCVLAIEASWRKTPPQGPGVEAQRRKLEDVRSIVQFSRGFNSPNVFGANKQRETSARLKKLFDVPP